MSESLKNRLLGHREVPPPSVWNRIADRLDNEFLTGDTRLSQKLEATQITPPADAWQKILHNLDEPAAAPKAKILPLIFRRAAVAAVIAVVLLAVSMYFLSSDQDPGNGNTQLSSVTPGIITDTVQNMPKQSTPSETLQAPTARNITTSARSSRKRIAPKQRAETEQAYIYEAASTIEGASVSTTETVAALQPIAVSAPLIRDENGKVIMDLDVISEPGKQYITVTSPNGNQTRISNKFLNCLSYINGHVAAFESDQDAVNCQNKFEEWRSRLLREATFIPAGDNFFDIFELKELIQD